MTPTTSHSTGTLSLDPRTIIIPPNRQREDTPETRQYIENDLMPSIAARGIIQPPVVERLPDGSYILLAGWCRLQSSLKLELSSIPVCLRENCTEDERLEIELAENFQRRDMPWQDNVKAMLRIHNAKKQSSAKDAKKWGVRESGKLLGVAAGHINDILIVARKLLENDTEVYSQPTLKAAMKLLITRKQDEAHQRLAAITSAQQHKIHTVAKKLVTKERPTKSSDTIQTLVGPNKSPTPKSKPKVEPEDKTQKEVALSEMLFNMDCHDWFAQREPNSVDMIYTDIPYGIDMTDLEDLQDVERVKYEHDVDENLDQMPKFLKGAFKVLKEQSYLFFWYDLCHHEKLERWAQEAGFTVQPYPLLWLKTHSCKNKANHCWWTKAVEYVMVCRKGTATVRSPQLVNWLACSGSAERRMQANPFAKPFEFSEWLLKPVLLPGMTVLDCYAGEGSLVRALLNLGARVLAVEKSTKHFPRLTEHVKDYFKNTLGKDVIFS